MAGKKCNLPFSVQITINRPLVLHEGDCVNRQELISVIQTLIRINSDGGLYVYRGNHDYPSSEGFTWHKYPKILKYLQALPWDEFRVGASATGWFGEPIQN